MIGYSLDFTAAGSVAASPTGTLPSVVTTLAWMWHDSFNGGVEQHVVSSPGGNKYVVFNNTTTSVLNGIIPRATTNLIVQCSTNGLWFNQNSKWWFAAVVLNTLGADTDQYVFVGDEANYARESNGYGVRQVGSGTIISTSSQLLVGASTAAGALNFSGKVAAVEMYSRALSLTEIIERQFTMLNDVADRNPALLTMWKLGEIGTGLQRDYSGNGFDLTVTNASLALGMNTLETPLYIPPNYRTKNLPFSRVRSLFSYAYPTNVPTGVLCMWPSTNASIPAKWAREPLLDGQHIRGNDAGVDPGATGGSATHSHTSQVHTHTTAHTHTVPDSPAGSGSSTRDSSTTNPPATHTHTSNPATVNPTTTTATDTPSTDAINHEPDFSTMIFIKPVAAAGSAPNGIPNNAVALWANNPAPIGWNLCDGASGRPDLRNKFIKGAGTGADGGTTGGGATHTHTIASHTHATPYAHSHPNVTSAATATALTAGSISGANAAVATSAHTHVLTIGSASPAITGNTDTATASNNEPPYKQEALIQNNTGADSLPDNIICLWLGPLYAIPTSWVLCDGTSNTPDLRTFFIKGSNTLADNGTTGGSLTHTHTATGHTHAVAAHTHTVSAATTANTENRTAGATATAVDTHTHPSWANTGSTSFNSGSTGPTVDNFTSTQPPYTTVAFIQFQQDFPAGHRQPMTATSLNVLLRMFKRLKLDERVEDWRRVLNPRAKLLPV